MTLKKIHFISFFFLICIAFSCNKVKFEIPEIRTLEIKDIRYDSAVLLGSADNDGGSDIFEKGTCWSESENSSINDSYKITDNGLGDFEIVIEGLKPYTEYYVRAFGKNEAGVVYGEELKFTTGYFTDIRDGKTYKTTKIGDQEWMAENLDYHPFLSNVNDGSWEEPYYYKFIDNEKWGVLYNLPAALIASPEGWHLPTIEEWEVLAEFIAGENEIEEPQIWESVGQYLKSTSGWQDNGNGLDLYGFNALPAGARDYSCEVIGYRYANLLGFFWSSSEHKSSLSWISDGASYQCVFLRADSDVLKKYFLPKQCATSIRCIRDIESTNAE